MLFEKPKYNALFIISFWALTVLLVKISDSVPPLDVTNPGTPPFMVQHLPLIVNLIFGVYIGFCLFVLVYNGILGPKLKKSVKNLSVYGIRSLATLVLILADFIHCFDNGT